MPRPPQRSLASLARVPKVTPSKNLRSAIVLISRTQAALMSALCCCSAGIQIGVDIFIVRNAAVMPYLRDGLHRDSAAQLPVLPPEVTRIEVSWMAEDDVVFSQCLSLEGRARNRNLAVQ